MLKYIGNHEKNWKDILKAFVEDLKNTGQKINMGRAKMDTEIKELDIIEIRLFIFSGN